VASLVQQSSGSEILKSPVAVNLCAATGRYPGQQRSAGDLRHVPCGLFHGVSQFTELQLPIPTTNLHRAEELAAINALMCAFNRKLFATYHCWADSAAAAAQFQAVSAEVERIAQEIREGVRR